MTDEEAIKGLQNIVEYWTLHPHEQECAETAISALRERIDRRHPQPLTLEKLREMDGEPVCIVCDEAAKETTPGFEPLMFWALVEVGEESIFLTNNLGGIRLQQFGKPEQVKHPLC
jgi:hypothetical protein